MRAKDWKPIASAKVLIIGEDSNLQWSGKVPEVVMFADYYFRPFPIDHGERSRNVESQNLFKYLIELTDNKIDADEMYFTNLCNDDVEPAPKGKRVLIPEAKAVKGLDHIEWILSQNPTIKYVLAMSLQTNYWLQKLGFYTSDPEFIAAAEPRRTGVECITPYYQPVGGKAFATICGNVYDSKNFPVQIIPILPAKDYPLSELNQERYGKALHFVSEFFKKI